MALDLSTILQDLGTAGALATDYNSGALQLQVKTNYTPALTVYNQSGQPGAGSAIAGLLGIQGGARVLDASGNVIMQMGDWPATDPVRVTIALGLAAFLGYGLVKLLRSGRR